MKHPTFFSNRVLAALFFRYRWCFVLLCSLLMLCCITLPLALHPALAQTTGSAALEQSKVGSLNKLNRSPSPSHRSEPFTFLLAPPPLFNTAEQTLSGAAGSILDFITESIAVSIPDAAPNSMPNTSPDSIPVPVPDPIPASTASLVKSIKPDKPARIPVLNYHSITVDPGNPATITPEKFAAQMRYLSENGYTTLTLKQFADMMEGIEKGPDKPVLLTFDDGYADNYEHALPILKELDFHATLFMSPGMVEDGYYLNWEQVKEMHEAGWDIQPHGMTHPHLPRLAADDQAYEISEAKTQIEHKLGTVADVFCYPYGERNKTTLKLLKDHKFRYAFTIEQGMTTPNQEALLLKRIFVNGEESIQRWISTFEK